MAYASRDQARALLKSPDPDEDALIDVCLSRAEAAVDNYMRTIRSSFVKFEPTTQTRYYDSADGYGYVEIHDLVSVTTLKSDTALTGTYATTIASTDYWLHPHAAPYSAIELTRRGTTTAFVEGTRTIQIVGSWGFPAVPADVTYATLATAIRMLKNRAAGFGDVIGVMGDGGVAYSRAMSAEVKMILDGYARWVLA
jgi:hypothetical protein